MAHRVISMRCGHKGRFAIVTDVGRDAVDAASTARRTVLTRTTKSCGPDAPTLASSFPETLMTVANKPGHRSVTGESTKETVKTIA
jgi:hypothetical protein